MINPKPKKRCRADGCNARFHPFSSLQVVCSPACGLALAKTERGQAHYKKAATREVRRYREETATKPELTAKLQAVFNAYIRARDEGQPCISCGRTSLTDPLTGGRWDAGHYRSVGACPQLRFEPQNVVRQCKHCNDYLGGNFVEYRKGLIERVGIDVVEWLEGPHELKNYTRDDLRGLIRHYRDLIKQTREGQAA